MRRVMMRGHNEKGAIAVIVAVLFGFGVMIAAGALTIDVGNINANRRQLQNGADAVALAAVKVCANTGVCPQANDLGLQALENANANPNAAVGVTGIRRVDGNAAICGSGGSLPACPSVPSTGNLQECPAPAMAAGTNYLQVYTQTTNAVGSHILPYSFGAAIAGVGSGANQQTCASVIWGQPSGAAAPITLSYCEWAAGTGNDPDTPIAGAGIYAADPVGASPGYAGSGQPAWPGWAAPLPAAPVPGQEVIIGLQGTTTTSTCDTWNGHDAPGGFGYLASSTSCSLTAVLNGWVRADTGNTLPGGCASLLPYFNKVIYLPVFDCTVKVTGSVPIPTTPPLSTDSCIGGAGSNTYYHVMGYAKFYLSGYTTAGSGAGHIPNENNPRTNPAATPPSPCSGNDRCVSGWFLKGLVKAPPGPPTGGPALGAYSIQISG